jgi:exodeoxyribonuclease V beta subunit
MLKGFIDLVCEWDGKFYLIDYKSNYLGDHYAHYIESELYLDIKSHHYELQFLVYTVALQRYLRTVKPDYNYEQDFGGVLYLYLRGLNGRNNKTGIYFNKPPAELIDALDALFG